MSTSKSLPLSEAPSHVKHLEVNPTISQTRRAPRFDFDGVIEVIEIKSDTKLISLATNLSQYGCRVSTSTPFDKGADVELTVRHGGTRFKAFGTVIHSTRHEGMGIRFHPEAPREWMAPSKESPNAALREAASFVAAVLTAATAGVSLLIVLGVV